VTGDAGQAGWSVSGLSEPVPMAGLSSRMTGQAWCCGDRCAASCSCPDGVTGGPARTTAAAPATVLG